MHGCLYFESHLHSPALLTCTPACVLHLSTSAHIFKALEHITAVHVPELLFAWTKASSAESDLGLAGWLDQASEGSSGMSTKLAFRWCGPYDERWH
eukprot:436382-Pelagomonas_calceolata.AAC.5